MANKTDAHHQSTPANRQSALTPGEEEQIPEQNPYNTPGSIVQLQRSIGNQATQRVMISTGADDRSLQRLKYKKDKFDRFLASLPFVRSMAKGTAVGSGSQRRNIDADTQTVKADDAGSVFSNVEDVSVPVPGGNHTLKGRYYTPKVRGSHRPPGKYKGQTILFLSGSSGSAETYSLPVAKFYCDEEASLLAVNYRGFGESETLDDSGKKKNLTRSDFSDATFNEDAYTIFNWCQANKEPDAGKIIVMGYSLGGPIASRLVAGLSKAGIRVGGLILHSALDSVREQATRGTGDYLGNVGADAAGLTLNTKEWLKQIAQTTGYTDLPLLIISGSGNDEHLDLSTTELEKLAAKLGFTNVFSGEGTGGHFSPGTHLGTPQVNQQVDAFFDKVING
jgi:pimeloyl-ACP methyl ester carboxylesterase